MSVDSEATDCPTCGLTMPRFQASKEYKRNAEPSSSVEAGLMCPRCGRQW